MPDFKHAWTIQAQEASARRYSAMRKAYDRGDLKEATILQLNAQSFAVAARKLAGVEP